MYLNRLHNICKKNLAIAGINFWQPSEIRLLTEKKIDFAFLTDAFNLLKRILLRVTIAVTNACLLVNTFICKINLFFFVRFMFICLKIWRKLELHVFLDILVCWNMTTRVVWDWGDQIVANISHGHQNLAIVFDFLLGYHFVVDNDFFLNMAVGFVE